MRDTLILHKIKRRSGKIFLSFFLLLAVAAASYAVYFSWKGHSVSRKINPDNENEGSYIDSVETLVRSAITDEHAKLSGEDDGRINILLLGAAGENWPGENLTDTIMLMSIDTRDLKVGLLSLPRDLFAGIPDANYQTKINQIYQYGLKNNSGVKPIKDTVASITGLPIHYFFIVDFEGFKKVIDNIGGVNITVERDIYDARYPGPNYSYEIFEMKKGLHHMDGETALKYARMRHDDPEGDFGRARRQQQVIQAAKNRIFSLQTFFSPIALNNLLDTLGDHVKTNVTLAEIESFVALSRKLDTENVNNVVVDAWKKDSLLKGSRLATGSGMASILVPRAGNWSEVQDLAENLFNLDIIKKREMEIEKEEARVAIINQSGDSNLANKIRDLVQDKLKIKNTGVLYYQVKPATNDTFIIDNTGKQKIYTLDELIKKIPARLDGEFSGIIKDGDKEKYDIILILGQDLVERYSFDEVSQEEFTKTQNEQEEQIIIPNFPASPAGG